ncbi:MAG: hypothetical protein FJ288_16730 [Planctomycetes bacterium]|nr:hypothetical protein [Planctomycetota bacterium]
MRTSLRLAAVLTCAALAAGCIEAKEDFTLNPDGSGKVAIDLLVQDTPVNLGQAERPDPEVLTKQAVRRMLTQSSGVEAWADVAFNRTDDGRTHFKGTAYFKEFGKVRLPMGQVSGISFRADDKGGMVLEIEGGEGGRPPAAPPKLSDDEVSRRITEERAKFQQMRPMMEMFLAKTKMDVSFRLPGTVAEATNLQRETGGALRLVLDGQKMLQVLDQLMADDAYLREVVTTGADVGQGSTRLGEAVNEKLFGTRAAVRARVTGDLRALFDYAAEAKAARDAYPQMLERLGLDTVTTAPEPGPPPGTGFRGKGETEGAGGAPGGASPPAVPAPPVPAKPSPAKLAK